jgi:hypothetical protein
VVPCSRVHQQFVYRSILLSLPCEEEEEEEVVETDRKKQRLSVAAALGVTSHKTRLHKTCVIYLYVASEGASEALQPVTY